MQPPYEKKARFLTGQVVSQMDHGEGCFSLRIYAPEIVSLARPGEFVMIKGWQENDPLLPRPFSFGRIAAEPGTFDLLYRVVGRGTELMSRWGKGDPVRILGPLGHAWPIPESGFAGEAVLIGRGLGIAPLVCLAEEAGRRGIPIHAYLSGRNRTVMLGADHIEQRAARYKEALDGSASVARVSEYFARDMARGLLRKPVVYLCGSRRLSAHVQQLQNISGFEAFISLETHMACGYGACKGCVHPMVDPENQQDFVYERVCLEGSVFPLQRVLIYGQAG